MDVINWNAWERVWKNDEELHRKGCQSVRSCDFISNTMMSNEFIHTVHSNKNYYMVDNLIIGNRVCNLHTSSYMARKKEKHLQNGGTSYHSSADMLPSVDGCCPFLLEANWHHHITSKLTFSELRTILCFTCHGPIYTIIVVGHLHIYTYIHMYVCYIQCMKHSKSTCKKKTKHTMQI